MKTRRNIFVLWVLCLVAAGCGSHANDENALALYQQGRTLRAMEKEEEAMRCFIDATHCTTDDEALLGRIYSNIELAFRVYTEAMHHFALSSDVLAYGYALNNMAWEQAAMGYKDSALMFVNKAVAVYPHEPLIEKVKESRAAACLFREEYDLVLYWTNRATDDYMLTLRAQAY